MKAEKNKSKTGKKRLAETQNIFNIARVRDYDMKYLLGFDLLESSHLLDGDGLMK